MLIFGFGVNDTLSSENSNLYSTSLTELIVTSLSGELASKNVVLIVNSCATLFSIEYPNTIVAS